MKVYRVKSDVNNYQWLLPKVPKSEILRHTTFDCTPRLHTWKPPEVQLLDPLAKKGDFLYYDPGALVVTQQAAKLAAPFFELAGELLPLWCNGNKYSILNVTHCIDALDNSKTIWFTAKDGSKIEIKDYVFDPEKFGGSSLFKIPETCRGSVLTWEKDRSPELEFKTFIEANGVTGLLFEELWDSEK